MLRMLASSWVTTTMVVPRLSRSSTISSSRRRAVSGSRPDEGSSMTRMSGIERHGARQPRALLHAAAQLRRVEVLEAGQPDQRQLEGDDLVHPGWRQAGVFGDRQRDVFGQRQRAPQRAALEQDAEPALEPLLRFLRGIPEVLAAIEHRAGHRPLQADQGAHQRGLAAAVAAHDDEDVALVHREIEAALDDEIAIGHAQVAYFDVGGPPWLRFRAGSTRWS
jgi:hypothetical protein